ncbi:MAG: Rieske (2Fe-2S) protein [Actinobacteria bacterium]|nr:Rieske (2Fe-2S) protein [Actinomycetota bacterium]
MSQPPEGGDPKGTLAIVAFAVAIVGAVSFATIYSLGEGHFGGAFNQLLGVSVAATMGGLGVGLVAWAKALMPPGPHVEERHFPHPTDPEGLEASVTEGARDIGRRRLLGRLLAGAAGAGGLAALFPLRSMGPDPFPERTRTGWHAGRRIVDEEGAPVRVDDLEVDSVLTVFPEDDPHRADSQTVLLRVRPEVAEAFHGGAATPHGYVAFSKVCTHLGCPVGLYQPETQRLLCPCHQSAFDVPSGAVPIFGPATRALPRLPIEEVGDGFLVATGDFPEPVGPGFWTRPGVDPEPQR